MDFLTFPTILLNQAAEIAQHYAAIHEPWALTQDWPTADLETEGRSEDEVFDIIEARCDREQFNRWLQGWWELHLDDSWFALWVWADRPQPSDEGGMAGNFNMMDAPLPNARWSVLEAANKAFSTTPPAMPTSIWGAA